ncbi:MAG: lipid A export permease/ATP-binding protein MsbA [Luminiphilus sp.]|nr:lipid A export permease/ATP-binding protein MsbA [Luminiphilus sp.]MBL6897402.1 lipid A export permease/ATP-binding protein MsbA [Luminiphilus sp.]MBT6351960.1 lipid A export permease/ATP-binding protein MsbA [Halieaceae bacterium]
MKSVTNRHSDWALYRRLLSYVARYSGVFLLSIFGFTLYSGANVLLADLTQFLLDSLGEAPQIDIGVVSKISYWIWPQGDKSTLDYARVAVPMAAIALAFIRATGYFLGNYFMNIVARGVVHRLRTQVFDVLIRVPKVAIDQYSHGELVSKLTFNVEQVSGACSEALKTILRDGLTVIALISYMLYLNWKLTLVFFAIAPAIAGVVLAVGRHFRRYSRRIQESMGEVTQLSNESVHAFDEIRMFAATEQQSARFRAASQFNQIQSVKLAFVQAVSTPIAQIILSFALGALFWFALDPEILAGFTAGSLVAFIAAATQLGKPIRTLTNVQSVVQRGLAAAEDLFVQIDTPPERDTGKTTLSRASGELTFEDVSFAYPGSETAALDRIDLRIPAGSLVAFVGRSGAGKTSLIQLLCRFYAPSAGRILLDGHPIGELRLSDYRRQLAVVFQSIVLFSDTVRANVAFGQVDQVDDVAILAALEVAQARDFVEALPEGLDTKLGDGGGGLSGGQRQRLAIARAVLKDAPVLILDEATSALDNESEAAIQASLDSAAVGRTTLVIAHRLSTVERADLIVVMDKGKVVAVGNHAELIASKGLYSSLYQQGFAAS